MAYASDRAAKGNLDIWVQQTEGGAVVQLTQNEADDHEPAYSPDGSRIAFRSERDGGGIYLISALGGEERLVARQGRRPRFSPNGNWIAYYVAPTPSMAFAGGANASEVYVVPANGGVPQRAANGFLAAHDPIWSPNGQLLFAGVPESRGWLGDESWWLIPWNPPSAPVGAVQVRLEAVASSYGRLPFYFSSPGDWTRNQLTFSTYYGDDDSLNLWKAKISPQMHDFNIRPERLTAGAGMDVQPSVVENGLVAFANLNWNVDIWQLPIAGNTGKVTGDLQPLTHDPASDALPNISLGGLKMTFVSNRSGNSDIWSWDFRTRRLRDRQKITGSTFGQEAIVPVAVELVSSEL